MTAARQGLLRAFQQLGCLHLISLLGGAIASGSGTVEKSYAGAQLESAWRMAQWSEACAQPVARSAPP